jgi:hypothetical protein
MWALSHIQDWRLIGGAGISQYSIAHEEKFGPYDSALYKSE